MALNVKQTEALKLLIAGRTGGQVAKALAVRPETISRWKQLPAFVDALASANDPELTDGDANITFLKWKSYDALVTALESDSDTVRVKAAGEVFRLFGTRLGQYHGPAAEPKPDEASDND